MVEALKPQALQREISVKADLVQTAFRKLREVRHTQLQMLPQAQHAWSQFTSWAILLPLCHICMATWACTFVVTRCLAGGTGQQSMSNAQAKQTCTNLHVCDQEYLSMGYGVAPTMAAERQADY